MENNFYQSILEKALTIRFVEEALLENFSKGLLRGTTHTALGQEVLPALIAASSRAEDIVTSNHRGHGHFLAESLLWEVRGDKRGACAGVGGSQHLQIEDRFFSNGILGGMAPVAVGIGLYKKIFRREGVVISYLGDGAFGQGVVYEALNFASLGELPIFFVVEDNGIAQSTVKEDHLAGQLGDRFSAFDIGFEYADSFDIEGTIDVIDRLLRLVRTDQKPVGLIVKSYRLAAHSKGDDTRSAQEIEQVKERDPIEELSSKLTQSDFEELVLAVRNELSETISKVFGADISIGSSDEFEFSSDRFLSPVPHTKEVTGTKSRSFIATELNSIFRHLLEERDDIVFLGEDIRDPYGGAFKVTKGLSTLYPERVISTPISEQLLAGIANGLSLMKKVAVVEIMFGDFVTLIVDQIINHSVKFKDMYNLKNSAPIVFRTPMGGYRGYGPTHSQCLEKIFFGVPKLTVVACDLVHEQSQIWQNMINESYPTLYIENKSLYGKSPMSIDQLIGSRWALTYGSGKYPTTYFRLNGSRKAADLVIFCYGGLVELALRVCETLFVQEEIVATVAVLSKICPLEPSDILRPLEAVNSFVTLEESSVIGGWGSEVIAQLEAKKLGSVRFRRVGAKATLIPSSKAWEEYTLPTEDDLYHACMETVTFE